MPTLNISDTLLFAPLQPCRGVQNCTHHAFILQVHWNVFFRLASLLKSSPAVVETLAVVLRMTNFTSAAARAVSCRLVDVVEASAQRALARPRMQHPPPCATAGGPPRDQTPPRWPHTRP